MLNSNYQAKLTELQEKINISFNDTSLLKRALTHKSFANENRELRLRDNERLEFLGDSVLDIVVSEYMFQEYPDYPEGELAKMRAVVVSAPILADKARYLNLGSYLFLGKGEEMTGGRDRSSILADAFEALVGSIYLDSGLEVVRRFVLSLLEQDVKEVEIGEHIQDYKTTLQELIQKNSNARPEYYVVAEEGPDHSKEFTVEVRFYDRRLGRGKGSSKKEAQQEAARDALENIE